MANIQSKAALEAAIQTLFNPILTVIAEYV